MRIASKVFSAVLLLAVSPSVGLGDAPPANEGAIVSGTVTYQPDPKRPWRYGRYYLKRGRDGPLSEALVCLSGPGLRPAEKAALEKSKKWQMDQKNFEYLPEVLAIRAGDEVEFLNSDQALHNVAAFGGDEPFNLMTPIGKSLTRRFAKAGNEKIPLDIRCGLHSQMHAWIYIFDHPFAAVTKADGKFAFKQVPPGNYDLVVIHPSGELRKKIPISVTPNGIREREVVLSPDDALKKDFVPEKAQE